MGIVVIVAYQPKAGKEAELAALMETHVARLRAENLVTDREPVLMKSENGTIIEVFEWISKDAIESAHSNAVVQTMWQEYADVCDYVTLSQLPESQNMFAEFSPL